jgi:hypothetical protein
MKSKIYSLLVLLCCFSCSKEIIEAPIEPKPQKFGDLQVEVLKCLNPPECQMTEHIIGADVFIYNTEADQGNKEEARFGQTNASGIIKFISLDSFLVYITVINDTFINQSFERVPQNSLSFHQVIFQ